VGKLENKIAIITGGASGIGRAIAEAFVAEGADVAIADKAPDSGSGELMGVLRNSGRRAIYVQTDVSQEPEVKAMVERVEKELGPVEILVNDAGIFSQVLLHEMSSEQWDRVVNVNLRCVFLCTRYVLPQMLERGSGKIINIGSQLGQIGGHEMVHYSASKGGVLAFTKALANEWAGRGVNVNAIAPGYMVTDNTAALRADETRTRQIGERIPAGRWGTPADLAGAAVFLASAASDYVNGHVLVVDGGWLGR